MTPSFPLAFCIILWIMPRDALSELLFLCSSLGWVPPAQLPYPHPSNHAERWLNDPSLLRSSPCLERKPCLACFPGPVLGVWPVVHGESANGARIFHVPTQTASSPGGVSSSCLQGAGVLQLRRNLLVQALPHGLVSLGNLLSRSARIPSLQFWGLQLSPYVGCLCLHGPSHINVIIRASIYPDFLRSSSCALQEGFTLIFSAWLLQGYYPTLCLGTGQEREGKGWDHGRNRKIKGMDLHRELGLWLHDPTASLASLVPDSRRRGCLCCPGRITGARLVCSMCLPGPLPPLCYWMLPIKGSERSRYAVVLGVSITSPPPPRPPLCGPARFPFCSGSSLGSAALLRVRLPIPPLDEEHVFSAPGRKKRARANAPAGDWGTSPALLLQWGSGWGSP